MNLQELEALIGKAEADATNYNVTMDQQPDPKRLQDLPDAVQSQLYEQANNPIAPPTPVATDPVVAPVDMSIPPHEQPILPPPELQRSNLLPVAKDAQGNLVPALPKLVTEPVNAMMSFIDSGRGQDFSQGVPDVTPQQIGDSTAIAGTVTIPSVMKGAGAGGQMFANAIPGFQPSSGIPLPAIVKSAMKFTKAPQPPTVKKVFGTGMDAPKDLETLEKAKDLYKTYVLDDKSALGDIAERAGVPNLQQVKSQINNDTQLTGMMKVNNALKSGRLDTNQGHFVVSTPPEQLFYEYKTLPPLAQKDVDQYVKLGDMTDDLKLRIAQNIDVAASQQQLNDAQNSMAIISQRTPVALDMADKYRKTTGAVRDFLAQGPNAMLSQKALAALGQERANYVPIDIHGIDPTDPLWSRMIDADRVVDQNKLDDWFLHKRDLTVAPTLQGRQDSFETLLNYTKNALQAKMHNDVRGLYADGMEKSAFGQNTMRPLAKDEIGKYGGRTVDIYKDGVKTPYVASQLQADLLKFDPHIAQWPALYATKRMFEMGTTGAMGLTFAPVNMIRDAIMGNVLTQQGLGTPGIVRTLAEVPTMMASKFSREASQALMVHPKLNQALSDIVNNSLQAVPFLPPQQKFDLAKKMASAYQNSMLALANNQGGVDASLMKTAMSGGYKGAIAEVKKSLADTAGKVPGANFLGHSARHMWDGIEGMFGAISDSPRMAAFRQSVDKYHLNPDEAAVEARLSSGDTGRGGRGYLASGKRVDADAVDKPWLLGAKATAAGAQLSREMIPYTNPMIQGLRRLANGFITDPVGTNLRAWKYVGLPSLGAYGWNEMLGKEYNDHAFKNRNAYDQAMTIYLGIPGRPPEEGIEIPLSQEMQPWASPFSTALYHMSRGDTDVGEAVKHIAGTILENGSMLGYPVALTQAFNAAGYHAPQSVMTPWSDVYKLDDKKVGYLPQNVDQMIRSTFGGVSDLVMNSAAAGYEGGPAAFAKEFGYQWAKKIPIVKNLMGYKTNTSSFTPQSNEKERKLDALHTFLDAYDEFFNPDKQDRWNSGKLTKLPEGSQIDPDATTVSRMGPNLTPVPTNPVFKMFGDQIKATIGTNSDGMTGLISHYSALTNNLRLLRQYTAGNAANFHKYQENVIKGAQDRYATALDDLETNKPKMNSKEYNKALNGIEFDLGEPAKLERLINSMKIDLGKRNDVNKLINYLEQERGQSVDEQMGLVKSLEDKMTQALHANGMLPPNVQFDVEKHLSPLVPSDFKTPVSQ